MRTQIFSREKFNLNFIVNLCLVIAITLTLRAFGADSIEDPLATEAWLLQVLNFVTTMKGLTSLALAAGVAQLVVGLGRTPLANVAGKWRLVLVSLVSVVGLVLGAMATGLDVKAALGLGPVLAAVQVFIHQLWKQLLTPTGDQKPVDVVPVSKHGG